MAVACAKGAMSSSGGSSDDDGPSGGGGGSGGAGGAIGGGGSAPSSSSSSGGSGGEGLSGTGGCASASFVGHVTNASSPGTPGSGVLGAWSYQAMTGDAAGTAMCAAIGADHVCTHNELVELSGNGSLSALATGTQLWVIGQISSCDEWMTSLNGFTGAYVLVNGGTIGSIAEGACSSGRGIPCCAPCP